MTGHETTAHASSHEAAHDAGHEGHAAVAAPRLDELFNREELAQLDEDDVVAGSTIGKMLSLFFLYTVIVMSAVAWWTYMSTHQPLP